MIEGQYTGKLIDGVRDSKSATLEWSNGDKYDGGFKNGLRHGFGKYLEQGGSRVYEGMWALSQKEGRGYEKFANGDTYTGEYSHDKFHGQGELVTRGGRYKGSFKEGLKEGMGSMVFTRTNTRYEGLWKAGRMYGKGLYAWPDGRKYEGGWVNGERHGDGIMYYPNGEKHDGTYKNNKMHGFGWYRFSSGKVRPGEWKDDQLVRWTGAEQFEAQLKARRLQPQKRDQDAKK